MREHYKNGNAITLRFMGCDGCSPCIINGVLCHESHCSEAWQDSVRECRWCGRSFYPTDKEQVCCDEDCARSYGS